MKIKASMQKTISLIKNEAPVWMEISKLLSRANARTINIDKSHLKRNTDFQQSDLFIVSDEDYFELSTILKRYPKLVIKKSLRPGEIIKGEKNPKLVFAGWPIDEETFLKTTSEMLHLSGRRAFRSIISLTPKGKCVSFVAMSLNFSLTGIAFKSDKPLVEGEAVEISLFFPGITDRVTLEAVIARIFSDETNGDICYGARFTNLDEEKKNILDRFIFEE